MSSRSLNSQLTKKQSNASLETEANSEQSDLICLQNPGQVLVDQGELNKVYLKMESTLKNEVIDRLNTLSQSLFNKSLTDDDKQNLWRENNTLISTLNELPILIDEEKVAKTVQAAESASDIESRDDVTSLKNEMNSLKQEMNGIRNDEDSKSVDSKSIGMSSICEEHHENGESRKLLDEIDIVLNRISKFDPKTEDIAAWLLKYEMYSLQFKWDDSERFCGLIYFLDSGLLSIIKQKESHNFEELRNTLVETVEDLLSSKYDDLHSKVERINEKFNKYNFSAYERNFWLDCIAPADKIKEYYEGLEDNKANRQKLEFFRNHMNHLLF